MSHQSFCAFVKASAYYSPAAQPYRNPRPQSANVSLPSPTPPATRLYAGTGPLPIEGDVLVPPKPQRNLAANYAATAATATTLSETPRLDREATQATHKQVSRPWRETPPKALNSNSGWKSVKGALLALQKDKISDLVKQRSQVTRQVRDRIQAFDKRVAILSSGGRKVAANESAENNSAGDAGHKSESGQRRVSQERSSPGQCEVTSAGPGLHVRKVSFLGRFGVKLFGCTVRHQSDPVRLESRWFADDENEALVLGLGLQCSL